MAHMGIHVDFGEEYRLVKSVDAGRAFVEDCWVLKMGATSEAGDSQKVL